MPFYRQNGHFEALKKTLYKYSKEKEMNMYSGT